MRILLLAVFAFLLFGCIGAPAPQPSNASSLQQNASNATPVQQSPPATSVEISGFAFSPPDLSVLKGTTITWTNRDSAAHTITSDSGEFGSPLLQYGETYVHTFRQAGTFDYHCQVHPAMKGRIRVYG